MGVFDSFRTLFNVRVARRRPRRGPKPKAGAKIYVHDVRMAVRSGLGDELWEWLQDLGFRETTHRPDRRRYRELPPSLATRLYDAPPQEWRPLLKQAIKESPKRSPVKIRMRPMRVQG